VLTKKNLPKRFQQDLKGSRKDISMTRTPSAFCDDFRLTRRALIGASMGAAAWAMMPKTSSAASAADPRLLVIVLRGALDGLAAVAPLSDPEYAALRAGFELDAGSTLPLDGFFSLNANMPKLHALYTAGDALIIHAAATDYRERSHFDGQDALESGFAKAGAQSGWLNRALAALPNSGRARETSGLSLGHTAPLIMKGSAPVLSWAPQVYAGADDDTVQRLLALYEARDPQLAEALSAGAALDAKTGAMRDKDGGGKNREFMAEVTQAARFLSDPQGPRIAAMSSDGWDTHAAENPVKGRLADLLAALDNGVGALRAGLAPVWDDTVVAIVTEFGRTAAINGTQGTDHGTGGTAFLLGGAVKGGRIIADWPGLKAPDLYEGRDLKPTTSLNAVFAGLLRDHLGLNGSTLRGAVFPDGVLTPVDGLVG
jgi:uncharacterized protein (DUF1501 family)